MTLSQLRDLLGQQLPPELYQALTDGRTAGMLRRAWPALSEERHCYRSDQAILVNELDGQAIAVLLLRRFILSQAWETAERGQPGAFAAAEIPLCAPPEAGLPVVISHREGGAVVVLRGTPEAITFTIREFRISTDPDYPEEEAARAL